MHSTGSPEASSDFLHSPPARVVQGAKKSEGLCGARFWFDLCDKLVVEAMAADCLGIVHTFLFALYWGAMWWLRMQFDRFREDSGFGLAVGLPWRLKGQGSTLDMSGRTIIPEGM